MQKMELALGSDLMARLKSPCLFRVHMVLIPTQRDETVTNDEIAFNLKQYVIKSVIPEQYLDEKTIFHLPHAFCCRPVRCSPAHTFHFTSRPKPCSCIEAMHTMYVEVETACTWQPPQ